MFRLEEISPEEVEELWEKWGVARIQPEDAYDFLQDFLRAYIGALEWNHRDDFIPRHRD